MGAAYQDRIEAVRQKMARTEADACLSLSEPDNFYLTGFTGDKSALIVTGDESVFLCDGRFIEQARVEVANCRIEEAKGSFIAAVGKPLEAIEPGMVAYDPDALTVGQLNLLEAAYDGPFVAVSGLVTGLRVVKSSEELEHIRGASELAEGVLVDVLDAVKEGCTEMELAARIEYEFKRRGAIGPSFPTIVLFGSRSSLPHGRPGPRRLRPGDIILIDMGCRRDGYCADLTRTFSYATIPGTWFDEIYQVVLAAQQAALGQVRAGVRCRDVDALARDLIDKAGYGKHFGHGLGHGVGIEVHESPRLNSESEAVLDAGMVVTVEPGIYLPGEGGVRIEDLVVVTEQGCEILTRTPKELKVLEK
ncbi:MAG TPA: Xaa-Pro peptidase family protein [Candidatus Bathyarchaeia archaeon]|nr:Xaa-Pro peptidase family protein [Candidatus Bathyarchaeia archaeon]